MAKRAKTLTQNDLKRLLGYISTTRHKQRNRALIQITFFAGLRVGEVAALRIRDVTDEDGQIRDEFKLPAEYTKRGHARTVFVNRKLKRELTEYLASLAHKQPHHALFQTQKQPQRGFTPNTLAQLFHHLYRAAGIQGGSSHSGRRTFITNLAQKGVGVRVLATLAGHKHIGTTQAYIEVNDDMMRQAIELA